MYRRQSQSSTWITLYEDSYTLTKMSFPGSLYYPFYARLETHANILEHYICDSIRAGGSHFLFPLLIPWLMLSLPNWHIIYISVRAHSITLLLLSFSSICTCFLSKLLLTHYALLAIIMCVCVCVYYIRHHISICNNIVYYHHYCYTIRICHQKLYTVTE